MNVRISFASLLIGLGVILGGPVQAQERNPAPSAGRTGPMFSWDFGGAAGAYNDVGYTEVNLGLNWFLQNFLIWRNSLFMRFPSQGDRVSGLDSSLRFHYSLATDGGGMGISFFGGPGYRFAQSDSAAVFGEAGLQIKIGGMFLGGGAKMLSYSHPGYDRLGRENPSRETLYFLILSGSGVL